jgi:hypothetical protein
MCSAIVHTDHNDQYIGKSGDHGSHLPIPESIGIIVFKERIVKEVTAIAKIYDDELTRKNTQRSSEQQKTFYSL